MGGSREGWGSKMTANGGLGGGSRLGFYDQAQAQTLWSYKYSLKIFCIESIRGEEGLRSVCEVCFWCEVALEYQNKTIKKIKNLY